MFIAGDRPKILSPLGGGRGHFREAMFFLNDARAINIPLLRSKLVALPWLETLECRRSNSAGASSVANPTVLFPTVRCRRTCAGFRAVWHAGDRILDVCVCVAAFHHRPHQNFQ